MAYGSNLLRERFLAYLTGGSGPVGSGVHSGAEDKTPPRADQLMTLDRRLIFTGQSKRWDGGGVCAVAPPRQEPPRQEPPQLAPSTDSAGVLSVASTCLGRGWLITAGQLHDVWRQENGGRTPGSVPWSALAANGVHDQAEGRYRRLDWLGLVDGRPAVTITCGDEMLAAVNQPTFPYLITVGRGLMEAWSFDATSAAGYLLSAVGGGSASKRIDDHNRLSAALQDAVPPSTAAR